MLKNVNDPEYKEYKGFCDTFNKGTDIRRWLEDKRLFVLDMDGTFYLDGIPYEHSLSFLDKLLTSGRQYIFFTNNSSKSNSFYINKLKSIGVRAENLKVITSGDVTINFLKSHYPGTRVYLMGTAQLMLDFAVAGIDLVDENEADAVDVVVCGFDMEMTYPKMVAACRFIRNGAVFLATHTDYNCPVADGFIPDCGSMCAMITASTGIRPRYLGKPNWEVIEAIMKETGFAKGEIVFAGDRLYTDIATGFNFGVSTVLVLSGETTPETLSSSKEKPDVVVPFLSDLSAYLDICVPG